METIMNGHPRLPLFLVAATLLFAPALEAQQMRGGPGGPGGLMTLVDPLELALEHREDLELIGDQTRALQAEHTASIERTGEARRIVQPLVEEMQERMRQMRGQRGQGMQGQRGQGMQGQRGQGMQRGASPMMAQMDQGTREAVAILQEEYAANMEFLSTQLTDDQARALRELIERERPTPPIR